MKGLRFGLAWFGIFGVIVTQIYVIGLMLPRVYESSMELPIVFRDGPANLARNFESVQDVAPIEGNRFQIVLRGGDEFIVEYENSQIPVIKVSNSWIEKAEYTFDSGSRAEMTTVKEKRWVDKPVYRMFEFFFKDQKRFLKKIRDDLKIIKR